MLNKVYCQSCGSASLFEPLKPKPTFCSHCGKSMVVKTALGSKPVAVSKFVAPDEPTESEPELDPNMKLEFEIEENKGGGRTMTLGQLLESATPPAPVEKRPLRDPKEVMAEFLQGQKNVKDTNE